MGGSYGGYATLAALTRNPDTYACGVDLVGPSELDRLIKTIPPYWAAGRARLLKALGNPDTEEGRTLLRERSPLYQADKIKKPLLIAQGENDPRVKKEQSDQIVETMQSKGIPVTYLLYRGEGHGFAEPENNISFTAIAESFLGKCLGGRIAPITSADLKGASVEIPVGSDLIEGYSTAKKSASAQKLTKKATPHDRPAGVLHRRGMGGAARGKDDAGRESRDRGSDVPCRSRLRGGRGQGRRCGASRL